MPIDPNLVFQAAYDVPPGVPRLAAGVANTSPLPAAAPAAIAPAPSFVDRMLGVASNTLNAFRSTFGVSSPQPIVAAQPTLEQRANPNYWRAQSGR